MSVRQQNVLFSPHFDIVHSNLLSGELTRIYHWVKTNWNSNHGRETWTRSFVFKRRFYFRVLRLLLLITLYFRRDRNFTAILSLLSMLCRYLHIFGGLSRGIPKIMFFLPFSAGDLWNQCVHISSFHHTEQDTKKKLRILSRMEEIRSWVNSKPE